MTGGARPASEPGLDPPSAPGRPADGPGDRARTGSRASSDASARPDPDLVLRIHVAFAAVLGVAAVALLTAPSPSSDLLPIAVLGVLAMGELIAILVAIAIAGATGRHSPLAAIDVLVTAPVLGVGPLSFAAGGPSPAPILLIVIAMLVSGLASVIVATRVVPEHGLERWALGAALVLIAAFWVAMPIATLVPLLGLLTLFGPRRDRLAVAPGLEPGSARPGSTRVGLREPIPAAPGPGRSDHRRGRAPDAAAVLAARRSGSGAANESDGSGAVRAPGIAPGDPSDPPR